MSWKQTLRDYGTFSRKDRIGILVLLGAIIACYLLPPLFREPAPPVEIPLPETGVTGRPDSTSASVYSAQPAPGQRAEAPLKGERFPFDPNTLEEAGWQRLGLPDRSVRTLLKYRSKGGRFRKPEDLQKIWGLPPGFYASVAPYIRMERGPGERKFPAYTPSSYPDRPARGPRTVSLNEADSSDLVALPGIGSRLAARILIFRDRLGGFHSVEQVAETYGLPDSTFQKIRPLLQAEGVIRKLKINTATKEELKGHPYVRWNLANVIVEYRDRHGPFQSLEDLKKIRIIDEATFQKIAPYLSL